MLKEFLRSKRKVSRAILYIFNRKTIRSHIPDTIYIRFRYYFQMGEILHLKHPQKFNEKLQWLKIYNRNTDYITMVDKYNVKRYVASIIGDEYIIKTYGVWESFDDINFEKLPENFVLKCTHDSGSVVLCKGKKKLDLTKTKEKMMDGLKRDVYHWSCEWPYKGVKPRILAEKYLGDSLEDEPLLDYKFFCFNGQVKCFKIDFNRFTHHQANYYDRNLKLLPFGEKACPPDFDKKLVMPSNIYKMMELAERLSAKVPFIRVDFYNIKGRIYFGELTFFPASGFGKFTKEEWDYKLGEWLKLPDNR